MKRVFATAGTVVLQEVAEPELRAGEVLVAPAYSVISSGTEMHIIASTARPETTGADTYPGPGEPRHPQLRNNGVRWDGPAPRTVAPPLAALGYSLAGTVLAVAPDVLDVRPGDRVACSGNQCAVHAERVAVPRNLVARVPDNVPLDQAAFVTLGCVALNGVRRANCQIGETIVIFGLGLLGLLAVQIARQSGLYVVGLDIDDRRVEQARALGAHQAINPQRDDPRAAVRQMTEGLGADAVFLAVVTPSSEPLNLSFDLLRQRGCVVGVGLFGMEISRDRMYARDAIFYPVIAYGPGRYDPVYEEGNVDYPVGYVRWTENRNQGAFLRLLAEGKVDVTTLAPTRVPFAEATRAYDLLHRPDRPPTVLLAYDSLTP
ncbi:MAG: zinc-dependent alcohol dehydrogenase [Thermomicrobiales bacterium]